MAKQSKTKPDLTLLRLERGKVHANDPIAFRPGPAMSATIADFADRHELPGEDISRSEVCNRIVCLAIGGFDVERHYLPISTLAQIVGGRNAFANTCSQILLVVEYNEKHLSKPLPSDLPTHVINGLLEQEKARMKTEINAGTEAGALLSKD